MKEFRFNVVKEERNALVRAISEIIGVESKYMGAPGFAFMVGCYKVSADGTVTIEGEYDSDVLCDLLAQLTERGYAHKAEHDDEVSTACDGINSDDTSACVADGDAVTGTNSDSDAGLLSIEMPLYGITPTVVANLEKLVSSKAWIIKKMTGAESLPIEQLEDRLRFPWFKAYASPAEIEAYTHLVSRLCETAKEKKRVMAEEKLPQLGENEKYKARCFLLSLHFNGSEYSQARRILLSPFSGNGSFLQGSRKKEGICEDDIGVGNASTHSEVVTA